MKTKNLKSTPVTPGLQPNKMAIAVATALLLGPMFGAAPMAWGATKCEQSDHLGGKPMSAFLSNASCSADMKDFESRGQNAAGQEIVNSAILVVGKTNQGGVYKPPPGAAASGLVVDLKLDDRVYYATNTFHTASTSILENAANKTQVNVTGGQLVLKVKTNTHGHAIHNFGHDSSINITGVDYDYETTGSDQYAYALLAGAGVGQTFLVGNDDGSIGAAKVVIGDAQTLANKTKVLTINMVDVQNGKVNLINGIRVSQNKYLSQKGAYGVVEINGNASINLDGRQTVGIYIGGNEGSPSVSLNGDTDITITAGEHSPGLGQYSAGVLLGKDARGQAGGDTAVGLVSKGRLAIDVLKTNDVVPILVDGEQATLTANNEQSSTILKGNSHLIQLLGNTSKTVLSFKNAQLITGDTAGSGKDQSEKALMSLGFNSRDVQLNFEGKGSKVTARDRGYLLEVGNKSSATLSLSDGAKMTGLTQKVDGAQVVVKLDQAEWQLARNKKFTDEQQYLSHVDQLSMTNHSRLLAHNGAKEAAATYVLSGNIDNNQSTIELNNGTVGDVLTINGDYHGGDGAMVKMDTHWQAGLPPSASESDLLHVVGVATGLTKVVPTDAQGEQVVIKGTVQQIAQILNSKPVVIVDQNHGGDGQASNNQSMAFMGTAQTEGMAEAQLRREGNQYFWTIEAKKPMDPEGPQPPVVPPTPTPIIMAPEVPGYVQMPQANMALGYATMATLHERVSEQHTLAWDECGECQNEVKAQSWARVLGRKNDVDGKHRFNHEMEMYVLQLGHDVDLQVNEQDGSRRHTGIMASYGHQNIDFYDRASAVNGYLVGTRYTGKGSTEAFSFGAYQTYYQATGAYIDLAGQVSYLRNEYNSREHLNVKQNGWSGVLSAEVGRPYVLGDSAWQLEPQAQLLYQYLHLSDFNDGKRTVIQDNQHGLRGRLGVRLAHNKEQAQQRSRSVYAVANIWHDFVDAKTVNIGPDDYREAYQKTWGEVGLGVQLPMGQQAYAYADARYEHAFSGAMYHGYRGTVGLKYQWR